MIGIEGTSFTRAAAGGTALPENPMKLPLRRPLTAAALLIALGATAPNAATGLTAEAATSAPSADAGTAATHHARVLGHDGAGAIHLGDSARQARRVGAHVTPGPSEGCRGVTLPGRTTRSNRTDAYLAPKLGIVAIFARPDMRTPEGIRLGSTLREVKTAYPDVSRAGNGYRDVSLGGHRFYEMGFDRRHRVVELLLLDDRQPCFG